MDILQHEDQLTNLDLEIDSDAKQSLANAAYWAKFISVFIFSISLFVVIIMALVSSAFMDGFKRGFGRNIELFDSLAPGVIIVVFIIGFLFLAGIYYFLYNFGAKTKAAMQTDSVEQLNKGLNSLKIYFIVMAVLGMLTIIASIYTFINLLNFF